MLDDLPSQYSQYLARFALKLGEHPVGGFVKNAGRLIKKLSFEEFTPAYLEYTEIVARYRETVERGDTINDVVFKLLREKSAQLVLEPPL